MTHRTTLCFVFALLSSYLVVLSKSSKVQQCYDEKGRPQVNFRGPFAANSPLFETFYVNFFASPFAAMHSRIRKRRLRPGSGGYQHLRPKRPPRVLRTLQLRQSEIRLRFLLFGIRSRAPLHDRFQLDQQHMVAVGNHARGYPGAESSQSDITFWWVYDSALLDLQVYHGVVGITTWRNISGKWPLFSLIHPYDPGWVVKTYGFRV